MRTQKSLALLTFLMSFQTHASDVKSCVWKAVKDTPSARTDCEALKSLSVPMYLRSGGDAKVLSWLPAPKGKDLWLLTYQVDNIGTSVRVQMERRAVIDVAQKKIIGETLHKFKIDGDTIDDESPKWIWSNNALHVRNLPYGEPALDYTFPAVK